MTTKINPRANVDRAPDRERVTAYLEPEIATALRVRAAKEHVSQGALIRQAIVALLGLKGFAP